MFNLREEKTITNILKIAAPDVVNGGEIIVAQVYATINNGTNVTINHDIWNKEIFDRNKEEVLKLITDFKARVELEAVREGVTLLEAPPMIPHGKAIGDDGTEYVLMTYA